MGKIGGKLPLAIGVIAVLVLGLAVVLGWVRLPAVKGLSRPIHYVRITGAFQQLGKDELKAALLPLVDTGFFEADMKAVQQAVAALPWVKTVVVKRVWPDTLDIAVKERIPFVRWGENSLMTEQGEIFSPKNMTDFQDLVMLTGPEQQQLKVLELMKGINTALADRALALAEFHVNDRRSWTIKLTTGLVILLGRDGQLEKLQRFLRTLAVLKQEQVQAMAVVDLRYPNGYAVSWKPDTPEIDWAGIADPEHLKDATKKEQE
jgi:cell division protein FtsQ